ncbi:MAG TPA: hypothetical protein VFW07_06515 [Parafilimonas sp.]|nr:hypothetical protein [Parafilimonas sp.]
MLKLLTSVKDFDGKIIGKHNNIYEVPKESLGDLSQKIKSGNIRNPWDWYVSLWAFGSLKKGALYEQILKKNFLKKLKYPHLFFTPVNEWSEAYSDATNPELFRKWLKLLLVRRKDVVKFGESSVPGSLGFLSYRYLQLYNYDFDKSINKLKTFDDVKLFDEQNNFINFFIYNENLESDFKKLMLGLGFDEKKLNGVLQIPKTNRSNRTHYREYYDDETVELVKRQDKLIIEKHNYDF